MTLRVLHGPVNVGNQPWILSRAERAHGLSSEVVAAFPTWLNYSADRTLSRSPEAAGFVDKIRRAAFGISAALRYDVLHYYFGQSYVYRAGQAETTVSFADLRIARAMGKRIIMTLQGCDIRQAGPSNAAHAVTMCRPDGCSAFATCIGQLDAVRALLAQDILPLCDRVFVLNPDLLRFAPQAEFLPYANVDIRAIIPRERARRARPLILHAPSDPRIKGSAQIAAALDMLRGTHDFEYRVVTGLPHAEAMALYVEADLVIDQVLAGWYGGFAVELMAMGIPVAAYIREEDLTTLPNAFLRDLPIMKVDPRHLVRDFQAILERREEWPEIGRRSRHFVETWHDPLTIAGALAAIYRDPTAPLNIRSEDGGG